MTTYYQVDFLALGEVTSEDIADFMASEELKDFDFFDETLKKRPLQFDTGIIYRKDLFQFNNYKLLFANRGSHSLKVANRLDFMVANSDKLFHIFVSHWPSRLWCEKNGADRHLLGVYLRDSIKELGGTSYSILLGDFNDEPFDISLSEQLLASRDRRLVYKKPLLFIIHSGDVWVSRIHTNPANKVGVTVEVASIPKEWRPNGVLLIKLSSPLLFLAEVSGI